jgi:hypothetical protein
VPRASLAPAARRGAQAREPERALLTVLLLTMLALPPLRGTRARLQLKSAEEAKQHMESTGHTNFEESTEAVGSSPLTSALCGNLKVAVACSLFRCWSKFLGNARADRGRWGTGGCRCCSLCARRAASHAAHRPRRICT